MNAKLFEWSDYKPTEGEPLVIKISTIDIRGMEQQHITKIPLKGKKQESVRLDLEKDLPCN